MRLIAQTLIAFLVFYCPLSAQSHTLPHEPQQFLVQLYTEASVKHLSDQLQRAYPQLQWTAPKKLIPHCNIWQLHYQGKNKDVELLRFIQQQKIVQLAQYNHRLSLRTTQATTPNDNLFSNQWQYINDGRNGGTLNADIDADLAWDIATGGRTAQNDTIVVAVIDDGIASNHPDLQNNLWLNHAEIPNNGIDDDNNGYVDDYQGWNSNRDNDDITGGNHGTSVAGIIGAEGNNGIGVAGVNWKVKLMIIKNNFNTTEANVLIAYGYALNQRIRYNQSNGTQGAFVVATNASWGLDYGTPSSSPLWCSFYDTLGKHGILNIGATANLDIDVDVHGDLPSTCTSDYLIGVTNINRNGHKETAAGYGHQSIDLGGFGEGVYTTTRGSYGTFGGTSAATPQVTGAVALLYAAACSNFIQYAKVRPSEAALAMRRYILDGVKQVPSLASITQTGGYLNLYNSLSECLNDCPTSTCFEPYAIQANNITDEQALIHWTTATNIPQVAYRVRVQGGAWASNFIPLPMGQDSLLLTNLQACTDYDMQLISVCGGSNSDTTHFSFHTDGCCRPPSYVTIQNTSHNYITLSWESVLAVQEYIVSYKEQNSSIWQTINTTDTMIQITGLDSCNFYDFKVQGLCTNGNSTTFTPILTHSTLGCASCALINYCAAQGANSTDDWIDTFRIDQHINASGNNAGYALFDSLNITLKKGKYHYVSIRQGQYFPQVVRIWLDLNQDGDFDDFNEQVWEGTIPLNYNIIQDSFLLPTTANLGSTRMRVATSWRSAPNPCGNVAYGEVEDYCVEIESNTAIPVIQNTLPQITIAPNPFQQEFQIFLEIKQSSTIQGQLYNTTGQLVASTAWHNVANGSQKLSWNPKIPQGLYLLRLLTDQGQVIKQIVKY